MSTALDQYRLLGRSGLRVSPLSLGTMTFGSDWGWGADADEARRIFDLYVDRGGNVIDTSVNYTNGTSEQMVGAFAREKRERLVLATKFTMARDPGDPNSGGNHRLNIVRSVEQSLRQLGTDRIDLFYLKCKSPAFLSEALWLSHLPRSALLRTHWSLLPTLASWWILA